MLHTPSVKLEKKNKNQNLLQAADFKSPFNTTLPHNLQFKWNNLGLLNTIGFGRHASPTLLIVTWMMYSVLFFPHFSHMTAVPPNLLIPSSNLLMMLELIKNAAYINDVQHLEKPQLGSQHWKDQRNGCRLYRGGGESHALKHKILLVTVIYQKYMLSTHSTQHIFLTHFSIFLMVPSYII